MSFLIYLLIFSILPYLSTSYRYGIIRNASIQLPFNISDDYGYKSTVKHCNECLCDAFMNSTKVHLFTCTKNSLMNYTCQFYYFMPTRDEIDYPRNDITIYVKENGTFGEKDDCCNTKFLINMINNANITNPETDPINKGLRSIVLGDNNTIVAVNQNAVFIFDKLTLKIINQKGFTNLKSIGYYDKKYYLGTATSIEVYDETLTSFLYSVSIGEPVVAIRFLNDNQMLVGTEKSGARMYTRNHINENFTTRIDINGASSGQVPAIFIVNENAFYLGWDEVSRNLSLYTKDQSNYSWNKNENGSISFNEKAADIVIDNCKRIWVVEAYTKRIFIYDPKDKSPRDTITFKWDLFNLLILENYTLVTSHGSAPGLSRIQSPLNCRPPR